MIISIYKFYKYVNIVEKVFMQKNYIMYIYIHNYNNYLSRIKSNDKNQLILPFMIPEGEIAMVSEVNYFRKKRGKILSKQISHIFKFKPFGLSVLDVGGTPIYWDNIDITGIKSILIINHSEGELKKLGYLGGDGKIKLGLGDARNLSEYEDHSFDLIHSNSVIEHVGNWGDMVSMANEVRRVGISGWIQTPAWEFVIEPHFRLPFIHWFSATIRANILKLSKQYRKISLNDRRLHVERINLVSWSEFNILFPGCEIFVERSWLLPKSYVARW